MAARPSDHAVVAITLILGLALGLALITTAAAAAGPSGDPPAAVPAAGSDPPVARAGDRLLFSAAALAAIEAARAGVAAPAVAGGQLADRLRPAPEWLHLSAIVHHGGRDWRIWLNGETWTPATRRAAIEIVEVSAAAVRLIWHGEAARTVTLAPNQSYRTRDGTVIEGRPPIAGPSLGWRDR